MTHAGTLFDHPEWMFGQRRAWFHGGGVLLPALLVPLDCPASCSQRSIGLTLARWVKHCARNGQTLKSLPWLC
ncbi:MAG: hypothetical protein ACRER2_03650 [Methylococcales bacterium]